VIGADLVHLGGLRRQGPARRLHELVERQAFEHGARTVHLETNLSLTEAIALYRSSGYREVPAFNDEPYADHWFEKRLNRRALSPTPTHRTLA